MRPSTRREFIAGPVGRIECAVDGPQGTPIGVALIAHPHPLFGGTLDNKVVQTLARAFVELGWEAWRPNFRGVGATEGVHDEGRGEVDDLASIVAHLAPSNPYLAATLKLWEQGHFLNFNGVTRWVSALWAFAALGYLIYLAAGRRDGAR
jgi:alpha/beta superfamily hydrolase